MDIFDPWRGVYKISGPVNLLSNVETSCPATKMSEQLILLENEYIDDDDLFCENLSLQSTQVTSFWKITKDLDFTSLIEKSRPTKLHSTLTDFESTSSNVDTTYTSQWSEESFRQVADIDCAAFNKLSGNNPSPATNLQSRQAEANYLTGEQKLSLSIEPHFNYEDSTKVIEQQSGVDGSKHDMSPYTISTTSKTKLVPDTARGQISDHDTQNTTLDNEHTPVNHRNQSNLSNHNLNNTRKKGKKKGIVRKKVTISKLQHKTKLEIISAYMKLEKKLDLETKNSHEAKITQLKKVIAEYKRNKISVEKIINDNAEKKDQSVEAIIAQKQKVETEAFTEATKLNKKLKDSNKKLEESNKVNTKKQNEIRKLKDSLKVARYKQILYRMK